MTYGIAEVAGRVQVMGASTDDVRLALELLGAARAVQAEETARVADGLVGLMLQTHMDLVTPDALEQARRLGQLRMALLGTPCYSYDTLAELRGASVGATRTWVSRMQQRREIFTVTHQGRVIIPAFQLDEAAPRADLAPVLATLMDAGVDGWELWTWLTHPTSLLSGEIPEEVSLKESVGIDADTSSGRALRAAQRFAAR